MECVRAFQRRELADESFRKRLESVILLAFALRLRRVVAANGDYITLDRRVGLGRGPGIAAISLDRFDRWFVFGPDVTAVDPEVALAVDAHERGQDPKAHLTPGKRSHYRSVRGRMPVPFWIILLLVWGRLEHGMIPRRCRTSRRRFEARPSSVLDAIQSGDALFVVEHPVLSGINLLVGS